MSLRHHDWLNRNAIRAFPLTQTPAVSDQGWELPTGLIVDLFCAVPAHSIGLKQVFITESLLTVVFVDLSTGVSIASASILVSKLDEYKTSQLLPLVDGVAGTITFGPSAQPDCFPLLPRGMHFFPNIPVESRCVIATSVFPVLGIGSMAGPTLNGEVELNPGSGLILNYVEAVDSNNDPLQQVTLSLGNPADFIGPCAAPVDGFQCSPPPILKINDVTGDANGNITVEFDGFTSNRTVNSSIKVLELRTGAEFCSLPSSPRQLRTASGQLRCRRQADHPIQYRRGCFPRG